MYLLRTLFLVALIALISAGGARASLERGFSFSPSQLTIVDSLGYSYVSLAGCAHIDEPGKPDLPVKALSYAIPLEGRVSNISVTVIDSQLIGLTKPLYPGQLPYFYLAEDTTTREFMEPDSSVYNSSEPFPGVLATGGYESYFAGLKIANILVYPVRYIPAADTLILYTNFSISLHPEKRTAEGQGLYENLAKLLVDNPEDVEGYIYQPQIVEDSSFGSLGAVTYLIITADSLKTQFQPLADWNIRKGINTKILGLSDIQSSFPGVDLQQKIRNCIRFYYGKLQTEAVLLGGRPEIVPVRKWNRSTTMLFLPVNLPTPTDLYYSALDETWDLNGNGLYGDSCTIETPWGGFEESKLLDYYGEVWVGRAQVSTSDEVQTFIQKRLSYEQNPPVYDNGTGKDFLFLGSAIDIPGGFLFSGGKIKEASVSELEEPISYYMMYDDDCEDIWDEQISAQRAKDKLEGGFYGINHAGHGYWDYIEVKPNTSPHQQYRLTIDDLDELTNGPRYGVFSTIACLSAAFDTTEDKCFGEHWLSNPQGGGVGFIGHSRLGVGGFADTLDKKYMKYLIDIWPGHPYPLPGSIYGMGRMYGMAKNEYISRLPKPWQDGELHSLLWNDYIYEVCNWSLLGDPCMAVWTSPPKSLQVSHPLYIPTEEYPCLVQVTSEGSPLQGATVCLYKDGQIFSRGLTNSAGEASLVIHPQTPGTLSVLVTMTQGKNNKYIPYQGGAAVLPATSGHITQSQDWSGVILVTGDVTVDTSVVLTVQPGTEVIFMPNQDNEKTGVDTLRCELIVEGELIISSAGADSVVLSSPLSGGWYGVRFKPRSQGQIQGAVVENGYCGVFMDTASVVTIEGSSIRGNEMYGLRCHHTDSATVISSNTIFGNHSHGIYAEGCSPSIIGNSFPNLNENYAIWVVGESPDRQMVIKGNTILMPCIECENKLEEGPRGITVEYAAPQIEDNTIIGGAYGIFGVGLDSTALIKGSGEVSQKLDRNCIGLALYSGSRPIVSNNQISDYGDIGVACYESCPLLGDSLIPGSGYNSITPGHCSPQYGLYCEGVTDTIKAEENWWGQSPPEPSWFWGPVDYEPWLTGPPDVGVEPTPKPPLPDHFSLAQNYPNPFNPTTVIRYSLPVDRYRPSAVGGSRARATSTIDVSLKVYNVLGQEVRTLVDEEQAPGYYSVHWDGRDSSGRELASGVYIYRIRAGDFVQVRRMLLLK